MPVTETAVGQYHTAVCDFLTYNWTSSWTVNCLLRLNDQCAFVDGYPVFDPIEPAFLSALGSGHPGSENGFLPAERSTRFWRYLRSPTVSEWLLHHSDS